MTPNFRCVSIALAAFAALPALAQTPRGVDEAALIQAAPGEWLTYGRDYAETHFSPLDQINSGNVGRLRLAWTQDLPGSRGTVEATPLVSNGVMYLTGPWSVVYAIDARTGKTRWSWDPAIVRGGPGAGGVSPCCGAVNRGAALYRGKVYVGLLDGRLVALDAETGRPVWVRQTTPVGGNYTITGAPRVVKGKVIIGNGGAEYHGVRGYVTAYDAETGDQAWRFYTVPGDPSLPFESPALEMAARTWTGEWWKLGGGGTAWDSFAYDAEANLLYIGTGNGSPWSHRHRSPGGGDNLFLNSIIALNPDNGEMVWYYQETPADNWDYTAVQSMVLADLVIGGRPRKVIMQAPKNGFFFVIDRLTGELLSAEKFTPHVTWASGYDMTTGRPIETPEARYTEVGTWIMPATTGAHNWHPMSFSPLTGLAYIPGQNLMYFHRFNPDWTPSPLGQFSTGTSRDQGRTPAPDTQLDPQGFLLAWDPVAQRERWRIPYDQMRNGGTMATAGNLVFSGRRDGWIYAYDATSGAKLWEHEVGPSPATPVTYELDGKQYVTLLTSPVGAGEIAGRVWTFGIDVTAPTSVR